MHNKIKLAVVGTGVVGQGVLYSWVNRGYDVTGYDVDEETINKLREDGIKAYHMDELGNSDADLLFVCISTPRSDVDGSINLTYMRSGLNTIGPWIRKRVNDGHYPMVVMRSTMLPTLSRTEIIPHLEEMSGCVAGETFGYAHLPEILRETDALMDSEKIWQVVIGELDTRTSETLYNMFAEVLQRDLNGQHKKVISVVPVEVAEAAKVIVNTFNATVISYFNMMDRFLNELDIDGQQAIDLAVRMGEASLNHWYGTAAGYPYGGKCLPKDVAATLAIAREHRIKLPQLESTQKVNEMMERLAEQGKVPKAIKGGFRRASAEDMRESSLLAYDMYRKMIS